jgi:hypothetical protein
MVIDTHSKQGLLEAQDLQRLNEFRSKSEGLAKPGSCLLWFEHIIDNVLHFETVTML